MNIEYRYDYQRQARAALGLLRSKLEGLAEAAGKLGQAKQAEMSAAQVATLTGWLDQKLVPEPAEASPALRDHLRRGLAMLAHNFNAASGTVTALGRAEIAEEFRAEAAAITAVLLPQLDEQVGLALHVDAPEPDAGAAGMVAAP